MKLPTAAGLWPAFWMMPDRGAQAGEQWKRQDTSNGGMEFDIMEHLSRWGPYRYNIAMHYDGYAKDHKQLGSDKIYVEPDKDGFITCGLLWTPGSAIYYCNGKEVLRWIDPRISSVPSILMFTLPNGGWDNNELDDAQLPADFVIDYVRVWQR
jgi:beta-glucanase (GH16 family)